MDKKLILKKLVPLVILSAVLAVVVSFFATPVLRVLRNVFGRNAFWLAGVLVFATGCALQVYPIAFLILSCWLVVGIYAEWEERGLAGFWTALLSVLIASVVLLVGPWWTAHLAGIDLIGELQKTIDGVLTQMNAGSSSTDAPTTLGGMKVDGHFVLSQVPSVLLILQIINLGFALMMDRKMAMLFGLRFERIASHLKLLDFRVPEGFVWVAMLAFLGTFLKLHQVGLTLAASNVFAVMMGLYFFQGLAVLEVSMVVFRVGPFMRFLIYFVIVGQLFFVLSAVGFADYWLDFRKRLRNFRTREKNSNNGEHI